MLDTVKRLAKEKVTGGFKVQHIWDPVPQNEGWEHIGEDFWISPSRQFGCGPAGEKNTRPVVYIGNAED